MPNLIEAGLVKLILPEISKVQSPYYLYRYDLGSDRYYLSLDEAGMVKNYYLSVTAFSKMSLATSQFLINWIREQGENAEYVRDERAAYGTMLHMYIIEAVKTGHVNFDDVREYAINAAMTSRFPDAATKWMQDLPMDIAAFFQFWKDRIVDIIAAEFPIASDKMGLAGTMDLVVKVHFNRKIVNAIIDIKSGRKGFWDSHELQLHVYKHLWNEHYSSLFPVSHVFNWAPTAWRDTPGYNLENQSSSVFAKTVLSRMRIARHEGWVKPPTQRLWLAGEFDIRDCVPARHIQKVEIERNTELFEEITNEE